MDFSKVSVAKFIGSNYLVWATQVEALLQARDLWVYVDESAADGPTTGVREPEFVPIILGQKAPREVWKKLADADWIELYGIRATLRNRLLNLRMSVGMTIREFVNEICTIERQISFSGKVIDEGDKTYGLLNGLRGEYAVKKTILEEKYDTSFEKMVSSLELTEYELNVGGKPNSSASASAS